MQNSENQMMPEDPQGGATLQGGGQHHGPPPGFQQQQGMPPEHQPHPVDPSAAASHSALHVFFKEYFHIIILALIVLYFCRERIQQWWNDYQSQNAVKASRISSDRDLDDGVRIAREKQMKNAMEAAKRDEIARENKRLEDLAEKERKLRERMNEGKKTGGGDDDVDLELPKLSSGRGYVPSSNWDSQTGGGYRPSGFQRPSGRRG